MKRSLLLTAILFTLSAAHAQKTLDFANIANGINAPITNSSGQRISAPGPFVADLFYCTNTNAVPNPLGSDSFLAAGFNQGFSSAAAGYFLGSTKTVTNATNIVIQVRVWDTTYGSTYAKARDAGGQFGYSGYFVITLSSPPSTPTVLSSLNGFKLTTIHSPTQGADDYGGVDSPPVVVVTEPDTTGSYPLLSAQYGCGPWLEITETNNSSVMLTLHNSAAGRPYQIWSKQNLGLTSWALETNFMGMSGQTQVRIPMNGRTNLFLRTGETNASFQGLTGNYGTFSSINPDTMGAVGSNYFVELLNEGIAVFAKTNGQLLQTTDVFAFFAETNLTKVLTDTRILYDRDNQRWIASIIDTYLTNVILAVSKSDNPMDLITNWNRFRIPMAQPNANLDFDTLGMDRNGIYLSVLNLGPLSSGLDTNIGFSVAAFRKQDIYAGTLNYVLLTNHPGLRSWAIQPAINFDPIATNGYAWFVAKGPPEWGTNYYKGGPILYRRLQWSGTNAIWADSTWVTNLTADYRNYYDFQGANSSYLATSGLGAPQAGGTNTIAMWPTGSRLMTAVIRNGYLWTCQHVGLSRTNYYSGDLTGTNVDRSGAQWLNFQVGSTSLVYNACERVYDSASINPVWYYFPSLMLNCNGDMLMGYSGSGATSFVGAYYSWFFAGSAASTKPALIQSGNVNYFDYRWGDYSATTLDPTDDWSIWTLQEYAWTNSGWPWATWVFEVNRDP